MDIGLVVEWLKDTPLLNYDIAQKVKGILKMNHTYKVKQITKLYESCNRCGLPIINCICDKAPQLQTKAKILILSTEREFYRPSNTARLLTLANPFSTEVFLWERKNQPEKLLKYLNNPQYEPFLLFPAEREEAKNKRVDLIDTEKIPVFIIIDGTWKEARKIVRKSDYLKNLSIISLEPSYKSRYDLRRGGVEGSLCTIETAIEVLKFNGETESSQKLESYFDLFQKSFKAGKSGHEIKKNSSS